MGARAVDRKFLCSVAIVIGIAASQCGSTQYSQAAQVDYGDSIDSPLFMAWTGTIKNVVLVLPALAKSASAGSGAAARRRQLLGGVFGFSAAGFVARVGFFYVAWLIANYSYLRALRYTPASLVSALFSTAPAFVAAGSTVLLKRRLAPLGWFAVACTILGSVLVAEPWQHGTAHRSLATGVAFAVLAALAAASYKVVFKLVFDEPEPETVGVILAWVGVYAATVGSILLFAVLASGAESVQWGSVPWGPLLAGNIFSLIFNFLVGWGIAVSYPLFISLGTVLNVPLNIFADFVLRGKLLNPAQSAGIACILAGFGLLLYCDMRERAQLVQTEEPEVDTSADCVDASLSGCEASNRT